MLQMRKRTIFIALLGLVILGSSVLAFYWYSEGRSPKEQAQTHYERGVALAKQHEYVKATIELRNSLRLQNDKVEVWRALAGIAETSRQWNDLIQSLQSIASLAPDDDETRIKLVKLLALSGRVYQALDLINADYGDDNQNPKILGLKAAILYKLNDKRGAVGEAQKALAIEPGNTDALVVLANERMASGDLSGALQILGRNLPRA